MNTTATAPKPGTVTAAARAAAATPAVSTAAMVATAEGDAPTADAFRAAIAAVSVADSTSDTATATLAAIAVARYAHHATRYAVPTENGSVLPDNHRRDVSALVWLEATGSAFPPAAADRTKGESTLGQYVSRYARVATNLAHGLTPFDGGVDSVNAAHDAIAGDVKSVKEAKEDKAFIVFVGTLNETERAAFDYVTATMRSFGSEHRAAFIRTIPAPK